MNEITEVEKSFYYFIHDKSGSFKEALFHAIMKADIINKFKLSLGFPEEVRVVNNYQNTAGYWEELCEKMTNKSKI